jgi:hypothetical protein
VFKGHPELSVDALRGLLPPDARARLDQVRPMLVRELKGLMVKDEIYDDSIARLEADLTGEFLSAATRLGLEIPGSLLQFGRSQTMLDDTFRRAHKALVELSQRPPPITPAVEERAFDDAGDAAVAGSTWAVVRKAGLGFGLGVSSKAAYRGMLDELQDHPVFISTMAYYNAAKEARDVLENDVQAERTDRQELVHRHVHEWAMDGEFFEDEKWAVYVDALPVELRQSPHLTKFKDMCLTPPQAYKSKEGDWETFRPFFQGQSALLDGVLGSLESLFQFEREYEQKRVALPPADPIGKVLAFEREKFLAALQGERPAEVPEVREKAAVEEIKLPNEGVAEKLQDFIQSDAVPN